MLFLARGESVRLVWVRFAIMGLASAALWLIGLGLSIKGIEVMPRIVFVPALAVTELGAGVMFAVWLGIMAKATFHFRLKRSDAVIAAAMLTLLLAGCGGSTTTIMYAPATPTWDTNTPFPPDLTATPMPGETPDPTLKPELFAPVSPLMQLPGVPAGTINGLPMPGTHGKP